MICDGFFLMKIAASRAFSWLVFLAYATWSCVCSVQSLLLRCVRRKYLITTRAISYQYGRSIISQQPSTFPWRTCSNAPRTTPHRSLSTYRFHSSAAYWYTRFRSCAYCSVRHRQAEARVHSYTVWSGTAGLGCAKGEVRVRRHWSAASQRSKLPAWPSSIECQREVWYCAVG